MSGIGPEILHLNFFFYCSITVVPIFPPLLSPALPIPPIQSSPLLLSVSMVLYTCSLSWPTPSFPCYLPPPALRFCISKKLPDYANTVDVQPRFEYWVKASHLSWHVIIDNVIYFGVTLVSPSHIQAKSRCAWLEIRGWTTLEKRVLQA